MNNKELVCIGVHVMWIMCKWKVQLATHLNVRLDHLFTLLINQLIFPLRLLPLKRLTKEAALQ